MVIVDKLSKGIILELYKNLKAEELANVFVKNYYRRHGFFTVIVSDKGSQFTGFLWSRVCQLLSITRKLSTAYHPETDSLIERTNQTMETYLRIYVAFDQKNWASLLFMAELVLNNRNIILIGTNLFFLSYRYHARILNIEEHIEKIYDTQTLIQQAENIVVKLKNATE